MLQETIKRILADTPSYFKKTRAIGISLTALGTGLLAAPEGVHLPAILVQYAGYAITAGFVLTIVSQLTQTTPINDTKH